MKSALLLVFVLTLAFMVLVLGGFYPVAAVDRSPIFNVTWKKAELAAKNFVLAQNRAASADLSPVLALIPQNTLTFLIEDAILRREGEELLHGFERLSRERMQEALAGGGDLKNAARVIYGLDFQEFQDLVLLPQARRDMAREILAERQVDFEQWFPDVKKKAKVRLMFVPFRWNGTAVE